MGYVKSKLPSMKAMVLEKQGKGLQLQEIPVPEPDKKQVLIEVSVCGVCRTDLHVVDGDLKEPELPLVPGHQIVGKIAGLGILAKKFKLGDRIGVPWLGGSCGHCEFCLSERENLCDYPIFTGYQINGGFAEYCVADEKFCFPIPGEYPDLQAAPLLCAGLIGYRSLKMAGEGENIGFYGFGAAAHILAQVVKWQGRKVHAFTRAGDDKSKKFAEELGAVWTGTSGETPPVKLDFAIIFAPAGELVPEALKAVKKGGVVVCAGIHMSDIPSFPYENLWGERVVRSVANLTIRDSEEFLELAPKIPVKTEVNPYPLEKANDALNDLRAGRFNGAAVITVKESS